MKIQQDRGATRDGIMFALPTVGFSVKIHTVEPILAPKTAMNYESAQTTPMPVSYTVEEHRKYLLPSEVELLMAHARKPPRHGHRDATMILIAYRHGLRASEVVGLEWHQIELDQGRLHVR